MMNPQSDLPLWHLFDNLGRVGDHPTYGQSPSFSKEVFGLLTFDPKSWSLFPKTEDLFVFKNAKYIP